MNKKDKFEGQKLIVLPKKVIEGLENNRLTSYLYITDIGFFPRGRYHYRERINGSDENILIFCFEGSGWVEVNGEKQELSKNMYTIIPKNIPHKYSADSKDPWTIYWAHFLGSKADAFVYPLNYPRSLEASDTARFSDRIQLFDEIYLNLESGYSKQNMEFTSILLMHLLGSLKYLSQFRKINEANQNNVVSKAVFYMKSNLNKKISLAEIASYCRISVSHFCLLFKNHTSYAPVEYLIFLRMQRACNLLEFSSLKINKVALDIGYQDAYYFSRIFKQVIGKSPTLYRRSCQS